MIKTNETHKKPLLRKASVTFLLSSAVIMIISAIALYFYTSYLLTAEIEEELFSDKDRIERLLINKPELTGIPPLMTIQKVDRREDEKLLDTLIYDPLQDEIELFRQLSGTKKINGQYYRVAVRAMVIDSENILLAIVFTFLSIIFLAFVFLFYLNKSRNEQLWKPFFINLRQLKEFSLRSNKPLPFVETDILEFDELSRELKLLTQKLRSDYTNLKQFTEDVAHEMQTPLAIMQAKIETLINYEDLSHQGFEELASLQNDIQRLKQLNKRLNLLAKIDNNQFRAEEIISLNSIARQVVNNFQEITQATIIQEDEEQVTIMVDSYLATVLFNNLISNALKHSDNEHPVRVNFKAGRVQVINSGNSVLNQPERIFDRFYRESSKTDSTGLGLSIVKKICDHYNFKPTYNFRDHKHIFQIDF